MRKNRLKSDLIIPGEIFKSILIDRVGLNFNDISLKMKIHPVTVMRIVSGTYSINESMANRIAKIMENYCGDNGYLKDPKYWVKINYEYYQSLKHPKSS
jgi:plasmid maintenance system antidote protein VapI